MFQMNGVKKQIVTVIGSVLLFSSISLAKEKDSSKSLLSLLGPDPCVLCKKGDKRCLAKCKCLQGKKKKGCEVEKSIGDLMTQKKGK